MPNWCQNHLTITGPEEAISKIVKACQLENNRFDFEGIVPMPKELKIESSSSVDYGLDILCGDWQKAVQTLGMSDRLLMANDGKLPETRESLISIIEQNERLFPNVNLRLARQAKENLERFGAKDWYYWSIANWGTKWNAEAVDVEEISPCRISVWFSTAWSPPIPVIDALRSQYPEVQATLRYIEPGVWMAGTVYAQGSIFKHLPEEDVKSFGEDHFGIEFEEDE